MINANSVLRIIAETLAQEIEASFAEIHIGRYLNVPCVYIIY